MTITLRTDPLPLRVDDTDTIRVGSSRVTLDALLHYHRLGMNPEDIARGLDTITLAEVYGALAYYSRHQEELDQYLRQRDEAAEQLREQIEAANAARRDILVHKIRAFSCPHPPSSSATPTKTPANAP